MIFINLSKSQRQIDKKGCIYTIFCEIIPNVTACGTLPG